MAAPPMDPLHEQRLRDEVIYLHSLWHQGPPRPPAAASSSSATVVRHHLRPSKATQFKKESKRRGKNGKKSANNAAPISTSSPGAEWPCPTPPPPPPSSTGWPSFEATPSRQPRRLSQEEQSRLAARSAHRHALKVVREFLTSDDADDSDAMDSSSDDDDDDELMEEDYGREAYTFFLKVFKEDNKLREYYEKNFAGGEFSCLVCGAVGGKNTVKKFKGCLPLVQHAITVANTKKRRAHRAFGQAICKVLAWDIDNLPAIVSLLSDKSGKAQGNGGSEDKESSSNVDSVKNDTLEGENEEAAPETGYIGSGISSNGDDGDMNISMCPGNNLEDHGVMHSHNVEEPASDGLTINSLMCPHADENLQNLGTVYQHSIEEPASQGLQILQPSKATQVEKENKRRGKNETNSTNNPASISTSSPGIEWQCPTSPPPPPPPSTIGWPGAEAAPSRQLPLLSQEQSRLAAKSAHRHALKVVREFFVSENDDDSDAMDSSSDDDDDDELMDEDYGREAYSFFLKVFKEDNKLRDYYEKNFAGGVFSCLVCGAVGGKKSVKKYKGCLPLVQHSITIANTKKRRAHRALGQAVCKVLAWDIDNLPAIVSLLSDRSGKTQGNGSSEDKESSSNVDSLKNDTLEGKNEEAAPETGYFGSGISTNGDEGDMNSLMCPGKNLEDRGVMHTRNVEEPASDGLTINSFKFPDADNNKHFGVVYQHNVEQPPVPEELTINSLRCPHADRNFENLGVVHPHNMEDVVAERLTSGPLYAKNRVGNEVQDQQMG